MFSAALFTIAKIWNQPKCPSVDEWIKQLWDSYTVEYYSAIKRRKFYPLNLQNVMLSETSQSESPPFKNGSEVLQRPYKGKRRHRLCRRASQFDTNQAAPVFTSNLLTR